MKGYLIKICVATIVVMLSISSCKDNTPYIYLSGETMGTSYHMTLQSHEGTSLKESVDSLLLSFNMVLSTYIDSSIISRFNASEEGIKYQVPEQDHMEQVFNLSAEIYRKTKGAFDPTVMPLVNYYGFGYDIDRREKMIDQYILDSLITLVGFEKVKIESSNGIVHLSKQKAGIELDFSSIAKGFGVDVVCNYLEDIGVNNYLVEIGGETKARGVNPHGMVWSIGINVPDPKAPVSDYLFPISLKNKAVATSGNYRNFYTRDSITYVHIIDPMSGESKPSDILSSTIVARDCAVADAYATGCIVMGSEKALHLIETLHGVEACFILSHQGEYQMLYSSGFKKLINE